MSDRDNQAVTVSQMKQLERKAAESGLSYYRMMENAGCAAVKWIQRIKPEQKKRCLIFCGKGNNGGDGFVAARKLLEEGQSVKIVLADGDVKTEDAIKNRDLCRSLRIPMLDFEVSGGQASVWAGEADVIVDAIYGTGFHGALKENARKAALLMNGAKAVVFALDIPSGLNGDSGQADTDTVRADYTIAFHRYKPAHLMETARQYYGSLTCADIGIPF